MNAAIFKSYDIRGKVDVDLNEEFCHNTGRAFADFLPQPGAVVVGYDMRPDSLRLAKALIDGLLGQGRDVIDVGLITSDMMYFAVGKYNLAGGAVVTASHNPGSDNGIKLYRDHVTPVGLESGLATIRDKMMAGQYNLPAETPGTYSQRNITDDWVEHCLTFVKGLQPFHIAIDAGNGMAGAILPHIIPRLAVKVDPMYFELDGTFPNHEANPQKPENMQDLAQRVRDNGYDFGIAFDGDGDRAGFVDNKGRMVLGSDLITIVAKHYLKKYPGSTVVHEVRTSRATQEFIKQWGGETVTVKAGRVNIGAKLREIGAPFGGETTGHFFFKENYDADSGLITALVAMQAISDAHVPLSDLVDEYHKYAMGPEVNFEVGDPQGVMISLKEAFSDGQLEEIDGVTINYPDKWFNVRASNTEPVIRLNAEARTQGQLDAFVAKIVSVIKQ